MENQIFDMFEFQDRTADEISKELNLGQRRVRAVLEAFGCNLNKYMGRKRFMAKKPTVKVAPVTEYPYLTQARFAAAERLAAQGMHPFDIAYEVGGISSDAISKHLARLKVSA